MKIVFPNLKEKDLGYCPGSVMDIESPDFIDFVNFELGKKWKNLYEVDAIFPPELFTKYRCKLENRSNLRFKRIDPFVRNLVDLNR